MLVQMKKDTQAIPDFGPLKEVNHVRQFLGCTNWIRRYVPTVYPVAVKMLGEYMKPKAVLPAEGLGHPKGSSEGGKAVRAIKCMGVNCIARAVLDEAGAIDGSRPLGFDELADDGRRHAF